MNDNLLFTTPKPFVFVLMPFDDEFNDIYEFGIKAAASSVGAYAERVDKQIFTEGILERIFNQICKADVVVADMTTRNPNVFYEVGYAHALGKIVFLLTQSAADIPFDLKNQPHTVYGSDGKKITRLKEELCRKLEWAISESKNKANRKNSESIALCLSDDRQMVYNFMEIPDSSLSSPFPLMNLYSAISNNSFNAVSAQLRVFVHNKSQEELHIRRLYFFTPENPKFEPVDGRFGDKNGGILCYNEEKNSNFGNKYSLDAQFPLIPSNCSESVVINLCTMNENQVSNLYKLRIHTSSRYYDFPFRLQ